MVSFFHHILHQNCIEVFITSNLSKLNVLKMPFCISMKLVDEDTSKNGLYPGWKNGHQAMITPWWLYDARVSWHGRLDSWHDPGIITMFSMIHTIIMVWSSWFPCLFTTKTRIFKRTMIRVLSKTTMVW